MQFRIHCSHDDNGDDDVVHNMAVVVARNGNDDDVVHNMVVVVRILVVRSTFYLFFIY